MTDLGNGWHVEEADRTTGQYTDAVYHEDCRLWDDDAGAPAPVVQDTSTRPDNRPGLVTILDTYTCACGAVKVLTSQEPGGYYEEDNRD